MSPSLFKHRWLVILTISALLIAVFVSTLPLVTRYFLLKSVDESLAVQSRLENLDINLFTGRVSAQGLQVAGHASSSLSGASLHIDVAMLELLRGNIVIDSVSVNGLFLKIEENAAGKLILVITLGEDAETEPSGNIVLPLFTVHQLEIENSKVELDAFGLQAIAAIDSLTLSGLSTADIAPSQLALKMRWNEASIALDGTLSPFADIPGLALAVDIKQLNLADFAGQLPESVLGLTGTARLSGRIEGDLNTLASDFELTLEDPGASNGHFAASAAIASWSGSVGIANVTTTALIKARGDAAVNGLQVDDTRQGIRVVQWENLQVSAFELSEDTNIGIDTLQVLGLKTIVAQDGETSPAAAANITVQGLSMTDNRLLVEALSGAGISSRIVVTPEGELRSQGLIVGVLESLEDGGLTETPEAEAETAPAAPSDFIWRIEKSAFTDSRIQFSDELFTPVLELELLLDALDLGRIDSADVASPTDITLAARVGEYGKISATGAIAPLAEQLYLKLEVTIQSLELPLLSPYIEHLLGYELTGGQYDHEFTASIVNEELTSTNNMDLRKLKVKAASNAKATAPLPMPLGLALDMLRDSKDNIELKVPLSGRLDDPDIGVDQVISTALGKALMAGSTTYLKLALQPYGAIWMGAEMGLKAAGKMSLDPMVFAALSSEPSPDNLAYAEKLSVLLTDRPSLELQLCGTAGRDDHQALQARIAADSNAAAGAADANTAPPAIDAAGQAQLLELAHSRQQRLKQVLVQQHAVDAKRLYTCKATVAADAKLSGVSLGL